MIKQILIYFIIFFVKKIKSKTLISKHFHFDLVRLFIKKRIFKNNRETNIFSADNLL